MTKLTRSVQILVNANLQSAFNYVSDLTRHPEWSDGELTIEEISSEPIQVGKEYLSKGEVPLFQKNRPNKLKLTEYQSPHTFGFVANDPSFGDVFHIFTFIQKENGISITRIMKLDLNPFLAFAFTFIHYPLIGKFATMKSMLGLKRKLES